MVIYQEFVATTMQFGKKFDQIKATNNEGQTIVVYCPPKVGQEIYSCFPPSSNKCVRSDTIRVLALKALEKHPYNLPCRPVEPTVVSLDPGPVVGYRATSGEFTTTIGNILYEPGATLGKENALCLGPTPPKGQLLSPDFLVSQRRKLTQLFLANEVLSAKSNRPMFENTELRNYMAQSELAQLYRCSQEHWMFQADPPSLHFNSPLCFVDQLYHSFHNLAEHGGACHFHRLKVVPNSSDRYSLDMSQKVKSPERAWTTVALHQLLVHANITL